MTKEEAIRLVVDKYPDRDVEKVTEIDEYFLISMIPKNINRDAIIRPVLVDDGLKAVDKDTGEVFTFNPVRH